MLYASQKASQDAGALMHRAKSALLFTKLTIHPPADKLDRLDIASSPQSYDNAKLKGLGNGRIMHWLHHQPSQQRLAPLLQLLLLFLVVGLWGLLIQARLQVRCGDPHC